MRCQVDFFLPLKLEEMCILGYDPKILLANQLARYFTFGLFDLLNLIPGPLLHYLFFLALHIFIFILSKNK